MAEWAEVFIVPRYQHMTFDKYEPTEGSKLAFAGCKRYAETFTPSQKNGLVLVGPPGTGKTHLMVSTARVIASHGYWPIMKLWLNICDEMREAFRAQQGTGVIKDQLKLRTLLMIDDLGTEAPADWSAELALSVINYRYEQALPTIITTNLAPGQIIQRYGERTLSRLSEMCSIYAVDGQDWRLQLGRQNGPNQSLGKAVCS